MTGSTAIIDNREQAARSGNERVGDVGDDGRLGDSQFAANDRLGQPSAPNDNQGSYLINSRAVLAEDLQDPEFRAIWVREAPARAVALAVLHYRVQHGLTQSALARRLGMRQPAIARIELGEHTPTIETLVRLSEALDIEFLIDIKPSAKRSRWINRRAEQAKVTEKVATGSGGEVFVAAG